MGLACCAIAVGCAHPEGEGFESLSPRERTIAAVRAGEARDRSAIPRLIAMLDSDDPAERFAAIRSLESITGETRGYDFAAEPYERDAAVARWVDWQRSSAWSAGVPGSGG